MAPLCFYNMRSYWHTTCKSMHTTALIPTWDVHNGANLMLDLGLKPWYGRCQLYPSGFSTMKPHWLMWKPFHYFADAVHGFPHWCKIWAKNWILKVILLSGIVFMVWVVPMVSCFWLFYSECSLTYVKAMHSTFPQWCKIWAGYWKLSSMRDHNHGMGGAKGTFLAFLLWKLIDLFWSKQRNRPWC
jgi:hypothetical protein